jgi:hypothetical protein
LFNLSRTGILHAGGRHFAPLKIIGIKLVELLTVFAEIIFDFISLHSIFVRTILSL